MGVGRGVIDRESQVSDEGNLDDGSLEESIAQLRRRGRSLSVGVAALAAESERLSEEIVQHQRSQEVSADQADEAEEPDVDAPPPRTGSR